MSKEHKVNFPGVGLNNPLQDLITDLQLDNLEDNGVVQEIEDNGLIVIVAVTSDRIHQVLDEDKKDDIPEELRNRILRDSRGRPIIYNGKFIILPPYLKDIFGKKL